MVCSPCLPACDSTSPTLPPLVEQSSYCLQWLYLCSLAFPYVWNCLPNPQINKMTLLNNSTHSLPLMSEIPSRSPMDLLLHLNDYGLYSFLPLMPGTPFQISIDLFQVHQFILAALEPSLLRKHISPAPLNHSVFSTLLILMPETPSLTIYIVLSFPSRLWHVLLTFIPSWNQGFTYIEQHLLTLILPYPCFSLLPPPSIVSSRSI